MTPRLHSAPPPGSPFGPLSLVVPETQDSLLHIHGGAAVLIHLPHCQQGCASEVAARSQGADREQVPCQPALLTRGLQPL